MTWLNFFLWLSCLYCAYYLINIIFDLMSIQTGAAREEDILELNFLENQVAQPLSYEVQQPDIPVQPEPASKGLGGVTLKGVFDLARSESIHLTKQVSF